MIIDLDATRYNALLLPIIEYLKFSPLRKASTMPDEVPLVHLARAFSSAIYNIPDDVISFEVANHKTSINKPNFCKLLGPVSSDVVVDSESIPITSLIEMFYQMGHTGDISLLSRFRKSFLPLMWNDLFTILFKSLSERVACSDNTSKLVYKLLFELLYGVNLDFSSVIWAQFVQSTNSTTQHTEVLCSRLFNRCQKGIDTLSCSDDEGLVDGGDP